VSNSFTSELDSDVYDAKPAGYYVYDGHVRYVQVTRRPNHLHLSRCRLRPPRRDRASVHLLS
jgi:hypothetical protein